MPQFLQPISIDVQWGDVGILPMVASDVLSNLLAVPGPECEISSAGIKSIHSTMIIIIILACDSSHHNTDRSLLRTLQLFSHSFETHDLQVALAVLCDDAKRCHPIQPRYKHC